MENWKGCERKRPGIMDIIFRHLDKGPEQNHEKSIATASFPPETLTDHFPNTSLQLYTTMSNWVEVSNGA
jgi:hypothetical protein